MKMYILAILSCFSIVSFAQTPVIALVPFSTGYSSPVDIKTPGDSRLFIVEQTGYIYICDSSGVKSSTPFLNIHWKVAISSEQGLLGLAFDPDYAINRTFYVYYCQKGTMNITIARYKTDTLDPNVADTNSLQILLSIPHPNYTNHDGGCIKFGPDGYLYIGTGDGGSGGDPPNNAQNHLKYLGKLLRIDVHNDSLYAIPADNPFVNDPTFYPEIYAYGLRNPWRYSFDRLTGDLWIGDVGQNTWEEVDYITAPDTGGQNYGWRCYEGTHPYSSVDCNGTSDLTWPIYEYQHVGGDCSITGGFVYRGGQYQNLYGKYIFMDYCTGKFRVIESDGNGGWTVTNVADLSNSDYSSFGEDRFGELYVAGVTDGKIYRLTDTACAPVAIIQEALNDSLLCIGPTLHAVTGQDLGYQWSLNGTEISGETSSSYTPTQAGEYSVLVTNASGCSHNSLPVHMGDYTSVSIVGLDSVYCIYQFSIPLAGSPSGGSFSGDGVSSGTFNPNLAGAGYHVIHYDYTNEFGCFTADSQVVNVDLCTGLNNDWDHSGVNIFPNPGDGSLSIILKDTNDAVEEIAVWNVSGQLLLKLSPHQNQNAFSSIHLNLSFLSNGVYPMRIVQQKNISYHKIIVSH